MNQMSDILETVPRDPMDYRSSVQPIWCPGCGDYSVLLEITKTLAAMDLAPEQVAIVSGIGCSSRFPAYSACYGFHGIHGRALPLATGLKVARPELTVIVTGGDGDGFSIGGNHFLHACRRNVDITYIVMDNQVYGMTKGQASPTTDPDWDSVLTPGGTGIRPFQPLVIALASGANFVARAFAGDPEGTTSIMVEGIKHPGFSFIQILSQCVTFRPEQRGWRDQVREAPVPPTADPSVAAKRIMTDDGFNLGILYRGDRPPYQIGLNDASAQVDELGAEFLV